MRHERVRRIAGRAVIVLVCMVAVRASSNVPPAPVPINTTWPCPGGGHIIITGNVNKDASGKLSGAIKYQFGSPISHSDDCIDSHGNVVSGTLYGTASGPESAPSMNIDGSLTMSQRQADGSYLPVGHCRPFLSWFHGSQAPVGTNCGLQFPYTPTTGTGSGSGSGSGNHCNCYCNSGEICTDKQPDPQTFCQQQNGDQFNICGCPVGNGCDGHGHPTFAPEAEEPTWRPDEVGAL